MGRGGGGPWAETGPKDGQAGQQGGKSRPADGNGMGDGQCEGSRESPEMGRKPMVRLEGQPAPGQASSGGQNGGLSSRKEARPGRTAGEEEEAQRSQRTSCRSPGAGPWELALVENQLQTAQMTGAKPASTAPADLCGPGQPHGDAKPEDPAHGWSSICTDPPSLLTRRPRLLQGQP